LQQTQKYESEKVVSNLGFADGLVWSREGYLVVADVRKRRLYRVDSNPMPTVLADNDGGASGVSYDVQGRLYVCESVARRLTRGDPKTNRFETLADNYQGRKFNSPNDVIVRRDGHVWFTDPAFGTADDHRDLDFYGIWHIGPKGDLEVAARWKTRPNGITLNPDGRILYVSDSDRHVIVAFDVGRNGEAGNQRDVVKNIAGVPGGIRTDVDSRLYVAARGVAVYSPDGKLQRTLVESENASNCTFGENNFESLFVSVRTSIFRIRAGVKGALQY
jgi:gluconolactonase